MDDPIAAPTPIAPTEPVTPPYPAPTEQRPDGVLTTAGNPNKRRNRFILFGIVTVLLLVGTISTIFLVQRNQELRERASSGAACSHAVGQCILLDSPGNSGSYTAPKAISYIDITNQTEYRYNAGNTNDGCYNVSIQGTQLTWSKVGSGPTCKDISNIQIWVSDMTPTPTQEVTSTPTPTLPPGTSPTPTSALSHTPTPTLPPGVTAACGEVEAYDTNWNKLTSTQLAALDPGDVVRFVVSGTSSSGTFDKAKFTVNGTALPETSTKKPGSDAFYVEYTIPASGTNFSVSAQVHHSTLGWI